MWVAIHSGRWRKYTASPLFHPTQDKQSRGGRYNVCCMVYYIGRCIAVLIPCSSLGAARETSHLTLLLTRILWFGRLRLRLESFLWTFGIKLPKGSFFESVVTPFCPFWFFFPTYGYMFDVWCWRCSFRGSSGIDVVRAGDMGEGMSYIL
jgi:hypothetical protein